MAFQRSGSDWARRLGASMSDFSSTILSMRLALFALLLAASVQASAQRGVLASPLPDNLSDGQVLEITRQVLTARGWRVTPEDRAALEAKKDISVLRVFIDEKGLLFRDEASRHGRGGGRQRNRDESTLQLGAVPQAEIDALRADLAAALAGGPIAAGSPMKVPSQVLLNVPAGADPQKAVAVTRSVFLGRRWHVKPDADGAFVADIRGAQESATLKVFFADGALRFIDRSTDRRGDKTQVPERWLNNIRADLR